MNEFWNARYARDEYAYGIEPNAFFKEQLDQIPKVGSILLPADGEGRNSVYAASCGWNVTAFDFSIEARKKAMSLASAKGVEIDYLVKDINDVTFAQNSFDVLGLIYVHLAPGHKRDILRNLTAYLKPGGYVIMEVFSKAHSKYQEMNTRAGGPKDKDMLYSKEEIQQYFSDFEVKQLVEAVVKLSEGEFHVGDAAVLRFTGIKK